MLPKLAALSELTEVVGLCHAVAAWFLTETKVLLKLTKLAPLSNTAYHHAICADKNDRQQD